MMEGEDFFMIYQHDWLMNQIQNMVRVIAKLVFKKQTIAYEFMDEIKKGISKTGNIQTD